MSDKNNRVALVAGVVLFSLAAVITISLILGVLNFGNTQTQNLSFLFYCGTMLYSVYGVSSFLIPIYILVCGAFCLSSNWSKSRIVCIAISVIPFFTIAFTEHKCRVIAVEDSSPIAITKIFILAVIALLLVAMEYLVAVVLVTSSFNDDIKPRLNNYKDLVATKVSKLKNSSVNAASAVKKSVQEKVSELQDDGIEENDLQQQDDLQSPSDAEPVKERPLTKEEQTIANDIDRSIEQVADSLFDESEEVDSEDLEAENKDIDANETEEVEVSVQDFLQDDNEQEELDEPSEQELEDEVSFVEDLTERIIYDDDGVSSEELELIGEQVEQEDSIAMQEEQDARIAVAEELKEKGLPVKDSPFETQKETVPQEQKQIEDAKQFVEIQSEQHDVMLSSVDDVFAKMAEDAEMQLDLSNKDNFYDAKRTTKQETRSAKEEASDIGSNYNQNSLKSLNSLNEPMLDDVEEDLETEEELEYDDDAELEQEEDQNFLQEQDEQIQEDLEDEREEDSDDSFVDQTSDDSFQFNPEAEPVLDNNGNPNDFIKTSFNQDTFKEEHESDYEGKDNSVVTPLPTKQPEVKRNYNAPYVVSPDLLTKYEDDPYWIIDEETNQSAENLKSTLSEFGIEAEVTGIRKGPVVTMFEILPAPGVKLSKIAGLQDNIALRLAASSVRIVAPIPGKEAVGIEIPNKKRSIVSFRECIERDIPAWKKMAVPVILGKDIEGETQIMDLVKTPHLLIAGATGAGKSVCVNSMILSILFKRSPSEVKMILIDPKIVELKLYNDIPHLLTPVITEPKKAMQALQYCLCEMERRYSLLDGMGVRDISSYNRRIVERRIAAEKLPYIIVVIDEFADLMATTGKQLESVLARLAAMSRAVGIHLVLATQRPSINVITGLIKANIPSRIAFMVASKTDSRIIIDQMGAEKLLGKGDMLYASSIDPFPVRIQGTFISGQEVEDVVEAVKQLGEPEYIDDEIFVDDDDEGGDQSVIDYNGEDPLYEKALDIVVQSGKASASYIQRRLKIGYNRAARLVEEMEERGIVGPANGSKPREIIHLP